ncbi:hypothetical protein [Dactylosporangium aurantiacum]|nr:hypothetical protein [Dactylosporangium aurantiacum]
MPTILLALAGCSTGRAAAPAASAAAAAAPSATASSPASSPSPSGQADAAVFKLGTVQPFNRDGTKARRNVLAYRQPTAASAPRPGSPGTEWASADVLVCLDAIGPDDDYIYVNRSPWSLVYADGTVAAPSSVTYQQFDAPEYPITDRTLKVGRCIRGWITFTAPAGQRATMVEYQSVIKREAVFDWAIV